MARKVNPAEFMQNCIPHNFWKDSLGALRDATLRADGSHLDLSDEQRKRHGLIARVRRNYFEDRWFEVAKKYGGTGYYVEHESGVPHAEVRIGEFIFTHYPLSSLDEFPPKAHYRDTLAEDPQGDFWLETEPPAKGAKYYGIFLYSTDAERESRFTSFASVKFPDRHMQKFVAAFPLRDLLEELKSVPQSMLRWGRQEGHENSPQIPQRFEEEKVGDPAMLLQPLPEKEQGERSGTGPVQMQMHLDLQQMLEEPTEKHFTEEQIVEPEATIKGIKKKNEES